MFKKILVCCDGSKGAKCAAETALILAAEQDAFLEELSVVEPLPSYVATPEEIAAECDYDCQCLHAKQEMIAARAHEMGVEIMTEVLTGRAPEVIMRTARDGAFDLLVLGQHCGTPLWITQAANTDAKVMEHPPCAVMIVPLN